jgi:hypothetical protein
MSAEVIKEIELEIAHVLFIASISLRWLLPLTATSPCAVLFRFTLFSRRLRGC